MDKLHIVALTVLTVYMQVMFVKDAHAESDGTEWSSTTPTLDDMTTADLFSQQHPHQVTSRKPFYTYLNISWLPPEVNNESIRSYVVYFTDGRASECPLRGEHKRKEVASTSTTAIIKGLEPGTSYSVCVQANYTSGLLTESHAYDFVTDGFGGPARPCDCDLSGIKDPRKPCHARNGTCICKNKAIAGVRCDRCAPTYYKHGRLACEPCGCDNTRSNGSCYTGEGGVKLCHCYRNYQGTQCGSCKAGYYNKAGKCLPCHCSDNSHPNSTKICDAHSGKCEDCWYNTTGEECNHCRDGFVGHAHNKTCQPEPAVRVKDHGHMGTGTIVVVALVVGALLVAGAVLAIHYSQRLRRRPFRPWSVQLGHDREDVNFSQMMENEWDENVVMGVGRGGGKGQGERTEHRLQLQIDGTNKVYRSIST